MEQNLSYIIVTPYTVAKNRIGGVISRLLSRLDLEFVGAQLFGADEHFASSYAKILQGQSDPKNPGAAALLSNYVLHNIGPTNGRVHRSLLLLFRGEDVYKKLSDICGALYPENISFESLSGETLRDTYADLIYDPNNPKKVKYFEPAVFTPRSKENANDVLRLFASWLPSQQNIVDNLIHEDPSQIERTLVIIKPENWEHASGRPGTIIDMFSRTGLRIIGLKLHQMSVNEALEFYGPVKGALQKKLAPNIASKAKELIEAEFEIKINDKLGQVLTATIGNEFAIDQFEQIVEFMSGYRSTERAQDELDLPGRAKTLVLIYEGVDACQKIRDVLGPTDPSKAPEGTVRREFGRNIMVNTAHASDSPENALREMKIVKIENNRCSEIIDSYLEANKSN
ncbi:MAG: nucleoside-diphosphate kinase [Sphaerochaetaceae bacterium]